MKNLQGYRTFHDADSLIAHLTAARYSWREPRLTETVSDDEAGRVLLAVRDKTSRMAVLAFEFDAQRNLLFSVVVEQVAVADAETDEWREVRRFPRIHKIERDEMGRWFAIDLCVTLSAPEWLAPKSLQELLSPG